MVKIFNSFKGTDPLGAAFANLGNSLFGDKTANALNSEKLYAAQRENSEMDNLMSRVGQSGAQNLGADPIAQAILLGSGYDPSKFGQVGLMGAATGFGAADPRTQNWQVGTGQAYDNTAGAFGQKMAETTRNNDMQSADRRYGVDQSIGQQRYEFEAKPMPALGLEGLPTFAPQGQLAGGGYAPILSETEQKGTLLRDNFGNLPALDPMQRQVLGANPSETSRTPRNYVTPQGSRITYDGVTDAQTGAPLPPGGYIGSVEGGAGDVGLTNSTLSGLQQQDFANTKFGRLLGMTRDLASRDPMNFGIPGFIKGVASDLNALAGGVAQGLGYNGMQEAMAVVRRDAAVNGISPDLLAGVFDPNLAGLHTVADLLVYSAAEALAGQAGRSVSDKDVQFFKGIVGDPRGWMMNQQKFMAKLDQLEQILNVNSQTVREYLGGAPAGAPQPGAPAAPNSGPQPGAIEDGFRFKGGAPADPNSWEPVR